MKDVEEFIKVSDVNLQDGDLILGLDVSTTCIGVALFEHKKNDDDILLEMTHYKPKSKSKNLLKKLFEKHEDFTYLLNKYTVYDIKHVTIEEPLLRSNNVNTVGTLLRFNMLVANECYKKFGVVPVLISSYDSRRYAYPDLMAIRKVNRKGEDVPEKKWGEPVLFGAYPTDVDKKKIIWEKVSMTEPQIEWLYKKNGVDLRVENFDMTDAYVVCKAYINLFS